MTDEKKWVTGPTSADDQPVAKWRYTTTEDLHEAALARGELVLTVEHLAAEVERLRRELSEVVQMVDETFGPFPVMTSAEAIKHLSEGMFKLRTDYTKQRAKLERFTDREPKIEAIKLAKNEQLPAAVLDLEVWEQENPV